MAVEGERADVLEVFCVDDVVVVILKAEVFPDDGILLSFDKKRDGAAAEVGTFRADVKGGAAVGKIGRGLSEESIDAFLLVARA